MRDTTAITPEAVYENLFTQVDAPTFKRDASQRVLHNISALFAAGTAIQDGAAEAAHLDERAALRAWMRNPGKGARVHLLRELLVASGVEDDQHRNGHIVAAIIEGAHNLSLIVDDAVDRDELRRTKPTIYALGGVPLVERTARHLVQALFALVDKLAAPLPVRLATEALLIGASDKLAQAILYERRLESMRGPVRSPRDASLTRATYVSKSFGIVQSGIDLMNLHYRLPNEIVDIFDNLLCELGIFLQRVNDIENYSKVKSCGSPNIDRFSDIRSRRLTLLLIDEQDYCGEDLRGHVERAFTQSSERHAAALADYVISSGLLQHELQFLSNERNRLRRKIDALRALSARTILVAQQILDQYHSALKQYQF